MLSRAIKKFLQCKSTIKSVIYFTDYWTERRTWKSKRKSPGSFQISSALKKQLCPWTRISCLQALQYLLYTPSRLKQSFSFSWWTVTSLHSKNVLQLSYWKSSVKEPTAILFTSAKRKKGHSASSGRVVLGLPSPSPRVCTDVRWRENQNFSAQRVYTKFAYPWCSASSAKKYQVIFRAISQDNC